MTDYNIKQANEYLDTQYGITLDDLDQENLAKLLIQDHYLRDLVNGKQRVSINVSNRIKKKNIALLRTIFKAQQ